MIKLQWKGNRHPLFCLKLKYFYVFRISLKIRVTASDDQICFLFIVKIEKIKIRPMTIFPPTHRPPTQQLTELLIIFERLDIDIHFAEHKHSRENKKLYFDVLSKTSIGFHKPHKPHTDESIIFIFKF